MAENQPDPQHKTPSDIESDVPSSPVPDGPETKEDHPLTPKETQTKRPPEQPLWSGRTSWRHYLGMATLGGLAAIALLFLTARWGPTGLVGWTFWLIAVAALAYAVRVAVAILQTRYKLTSERLIIERGIISQTIDQTELIRVDDVRIHKTLLDRLFGLASIEIMSTDTTDSSVTIAGVPDGDQVAEMIRAHMRTARRSTLFMESL